MVKILLNKVNYRNMIQGLLLAAGGLTLIYTVIVLFIFFRQTSLIHIPSVKLASTPAAHGLEYEDVWLDTDKDARLHGWFIPGAGSEYAVIIYHGNAGNISYLMETYQMLHSLGVSILTYDYRSYGNSTGNLTEEGMYRDAEAVFDYLVERRRIRAERIVLLGRSLGTAMASWVASERRPAGLIMESGFTSMSELARIHYPLVPTTSLLKWQYDSLSRIGSIDCPVLYIHSREDTLTPFEHSVALFEATRTAKTFAEISGTHGSGFVTSHEIYLAALDEFLESLGNQD